MLAGRAMPICSRAAALGGCQIHNAMVYVRGGRATYNYWANALGCTGWDYDSLVPLFDDIEKTMGDRHRGLFGRAQPSRSSRPWPRSAYPFNPDYNDGPSAYGSVRYQFTIEKRDGALRRTHQLRQVHRRVAPGPL